MLIYNSIHKASVKVNWSPVGFEWLDTARNNRWHKCLCVISSLVRSCVSQKLSYSLTSKNIPACTFFDCFLAPFWIQWLTPAKTFWCTTTLAVHDPFTRQNDDRNTKHISNILEGCLSSPLQTWDSMPSEPLNSIAVHNQVRHKLSWVAGSMVYFSRFPTLTIHPLSPRTCNRPFVSCPCHKSDITVVCPCKFLQFVHTLILTLLIQDIERPKLCFKLR